jgi:hypothetical protein
VGLEFAEEQRRKLEEERISAEETQNMQEELEQAAQMDEMAMPQGQAPQGLAPPAAATGAQQIPQFQGMPGAMPGGGMPPVQPAGAAPMGPPNAMQQFGAAMGTQPADTPEAMVAKAQTIAQQLIAYPEAQRSSALIQLKRSDSTLHALVRSQLDEMRQAAELQGREMVLQQQYGKQAQALRKRLVGGSNGRK